MAQPTVSVRRAFTARHLLEAAARRAGIPLPKLTSEAVNVFLDQLNLVYDEMLNLGVQLWGREKIILPLYERRNAVPTPEGTSLILSVNQRTLTRLIPDIPMTDGTGLNVDPALAFDDDFSTATVSLSTGNWIGGQFNSPSRATSVGILLASPFHGGVFYEYSQDGIDWTAISATEITTPIDAGQWFWEDFEGAPDALYWRVRSAGETPLEVKELFFGNNPMEIPMGVWALDDWNAMVVKETPGAPWNWYQDRALDVPILYVWPQPDHSSRYTHLVAWRRRYLNTVTGMTQTLDISRRWYEALTATMARRLCRELPEADMQRYQMLQGEESSAMALAAGEERDPAPIRYNPGLHVYKF